MTFKQIAVRARPRTTIGSGSRSVARILLRVALGGYLAAILLLTLVRFPYHVEPVEPARTVVPGHESFYARTYSLPQPEATAPRSEREQDSAYVQAARKAAEQHRIVSRVEEFVRKYHLERARILDVGSGTGYLQDVVENYVGLDISPTASRYYHKPFIEASATEMPVPDSAFDAAWSIWVLEHVTNPEQALLEIRRVVKDRAVLFLLPAWNCSSWLAQGYPVRPFGTFAWKDRFVKVGMHIVEHWSLALPRVLLTRMALYLRSRFSRPTRLHYNRLTPNYEEYWMPDSDAVSSIDRFEAALWFTSRGDECLNCEGGLLVGNRELIIRVHK